ncbi:hypothetical protein HAV15_010612 [Penicillium sp. str. |nr:hypothetical protein HAV15_010612 [Penicillium sp. str. \
MAANLRDHSRDHFNIKVYHQVAPKGVSSNRQSENKPQIANACWIDGSIFSVTNVNNMAKVTKYHARYAVASLHALALATFTKGEEFAQGLKKSKP